MLGQLPVELAHIIFSHLDPFAFENARKVSRSWLAASTSVSLLCDQLAGIPRRDPSIALNTLPVNVLSRTWSIVAHDLLLSTRISSTSESLHKTLTSAAKRSTVPGDERAVALDESRVLTLFTDGTLAHRLSRPLSNAFTPAQSGPNLRNASSRLFELALTRHSNLVAVALDRCVQIYDMDALHQPPAGVHLSSVSGHYVTGISFEHGDRLLRVRLSGAGDVLYLGSSSSKNQPPATFADWSSDRGLRSMALSSLDITYDHIGQDPVRLEHLQLLRQCGNGWTFVAQLPGSSYCIGWIPFTEHAQTMRATILQRLHGRPAPECRLVPQWSVSPKFHELSNPLYCMSDDGRYLAVAEQSSKGSSNVFLWRLSRMTDLPTSGPESFGASFHRLPVHLGRIIKGEVSWLGFTQTPGDCLLLAQTRQDRIDYHFQSIEV